MIIKFKHRGTNVPTPRNHRSVARSPLTCRWVRDPATGRLGAVWISASATVGPDVVQLDESGRISIRRAA
ncbi:hypothetical protein [Rhodoblastus sp.]|jgi:type IV secretory pathway TrbF-like protein|uniref:hypothetical protein n=1 Tax=Rhodoblastus sp. TaxID=1962975 RepID=UPI00261A30EB|nr:hypothetical protein [Rhodoblastus sp.]